MGQLQQQTKQAKPFENPGAELFLSLVLLVQRINDATAAILKTADLSPPQYNVLRILRGADKGGRTCNEIAERMIHRVPDVTRLLDRLEARGLITRQRETTDRRVVRVWLSKSGLALLAPLDAPLAALHQGHYELLGEKRSRQMLEATEALLAATAPASEPGPAGPK